MKSTLTLAVVGTVIITTILVVGSTAAVKLANQSASAMTMMPGNQTSGKMMKGNESSSMMKGNESSSMMKGNESSSMMKGNMTTPLPKK